MKHIAVGTSLTEDEFNAMRDSDEFEATMLRRVDAATGRKFGGWVALSSHVYVEGPKASGLGWWGTAYEEHAASTGVRVPCVTSYVGTPRTESRRPIVRCSADDVEAIVAIAKRAEELANA